MPKKRVLLVDDSVLIRRSLANALSRKPSLDIAGSAPNGRIALMKIPLLHPDVVILDIEMPEKDSLATLDEIRRVYPQIIVIMLSVSTEQGAGATLEALAQGAKDYVTKPEIAAITDNVVQSLSDELVSKIDLLCTHGSDGLQYSSPHGTVQFGAVTPCAGVSRAAKRVDVLAIGVSTGGPNALRDLLSRLPADFPVPILIVQHMPPIFTRLLAERLAANSNIRVAEGRSHEAVLPGSAWIAPGNFHMAVERDHEGVRIRTHQDHRENSCRPAVDVLFRSVAKVYGPHVLAVVMTGMGQDGFRGCQQIRDAGGQVLAQDQASSVVWGMPGTLVRAGIADRVVSLNDLAQEITKRVWSHRAEKDALVDS
jgi:two-component system chemotaxis response regulator CheB